LTERSARVFCDTRYRDLWGAAERARGARRVSRLAQLRALAEGQRRQIMSPCRVRKTRVKALCDEKPSCSLMSARLKRVSLSNRHASPNLTRDSSSVKCRSSACSCRRNVHLDVFTRSHICESREEDVGRSAAGSVMISLVRRAHTRNRRVGGLRRIDGLIAILLRHGRTDAIQPDFLAARRHRQQLVVVRASVVSVRISLDVLTPVCCGRRGAHVCSECAPRLISLPAVSMQIVGCALASITQTVSVHPFSALELDACRPYTCRFVRAPMGVA
jgi:hypothetical protein